MNIKSVALESELIFWKRQGRVREADDHLVVETPSSPDYYFGNLLYFEGPPGPGDFARWRRLFAEAFAHEPRVRHETFMWDETAYRGGEVAPFLEAGFDLEENVVLVATSVHPPPRPNASVEVRPLESDADWAAVVENQVLGRGDGWPDEAAYREFREGRMRDARALEAEGLGHWYGAFVDGRLVGDLGLFVEGGVGRFQNVGTHPDFRRRGVCGTLVHAAAAAALAAGAGRLVMVADEHYHAARVYESVGFVPLERTGALCRRPAE